MTASETLQKNQWNKKKTPQNQKERRNRPTEDEAKKTTHFKENHPVIRTKFRSRNFKEEIETKKHTQ